MLGGAVTRRALLRKHRLPLLRTPPLRHGRAQRLLYDTVARSVRGVLDGLVTRVVLNNPPPPQQAELTEPDEPAAGPPSEPHTSPAAAGPAAPGTGPPVRHAVPVWKRDFLPLGNSDIPGFAIEF